MHPLHSPHFVIDEDVLPVGAAIHAAVAIEFCSYKTGQTGVTNRSDQSALPADPTGQTGPTDRSDRSAQNRKDEHSALK